MLLERLDLAHVKVVFQDPAPLIFISRLPKRGHIRNGRSRSPPLRDFRKRPHNSHNPIDQYDQGDYRKIDIKPQTTNKKADEIDSRRRSNSLVPLFSCCLVLVLLEEGNFLDKKKTCKATSADALITNLSVFTQPTGVPVIPNVKETSHTRYNCTSA